MKKSIGPELAKKYEHLQAILQDLGSVAVAFSSGVDSTFLVKVAHDVLGEKAVAFTAASDFVPQRDVEEAAAFTADEGIEFHRVPFPILMVPHVRENPSDRCYYCKYALFSHMKELAEQHGLACVVDGSNLDDDGDYRPGHRALRELGIVSPLHQAGLHKQDIRDLSHMLGLPTWDKPSFACLASRFPYGTELTPAGLARVNQAEEFLMARGFRQLRVRAYGDQARIELLPEDIPRMLSRDLREETAAFFRRIGFLYTSLDLRGYRTGSMNEALASH
ncbi:ATP-dependent sacrificial sulfur transferase LarE [Mitsuokella jalaludinii]|uniref:ATP-dependent sacrificial sulfur transferase LarE n=1 Tax=Mitsuokella jalaludinii TaxID=187979 RepID=UPI0029E1D049|nr:ATP-dependent sacrificial sulfur transferase LarE [Selenomonadaceae bacterium]